MARTLHSRKIPAYVHVDMDSLWAVREVYDLERDFSGEDAFFEKALPRFLDLFSQRGIRASFFVIGRDCEVPKRAALIQEAAQKGHLIENHSYSHRLGLAGADETLIREEVQKAQDAIAKLVGRRPRAFRAPGYGLSPRLLQCLKEKGYLMDSSLLPSPWTGLMEGAARLLGKGDDVNRKGPHWRAPRWPYSPNADFPWKAQPAPEEGGLMEYPPAVSPFLRFPLQPSINQGLGWGWTRLQLKWTARYGRGPLVFLFHGVDLVGGEEASGLPKGFLSRRFLGMTRHKKMAYVTRYLDFLKARFTLEQFSAPPAKMNLFS